MHLLAYCRPGFERECLQDLQHVLAPIGGHGLADIQDQAGFLVYNAPDLDPHWRPTRDLWNSFTFVRQLLVVHAPVVFHDQDRVNPLLQALDAWDYPAAQARLYGELWLEGPDTNDGKSLSPFFKKFQIPLQNGLKRSGWKQVFAKTKGIPRLHLFFPDYDTALVGFSTPGASSSWPMGIPRLKLPPEAPSRSTLKLDEAIMTFLTFDQQKKLGEGLRAVDLGASPGGWTYQMIQRGMFVTAVDNGPMDARIMASGLVEHLQQDGFRFQPKKPVDLMVCDIVETPQRVAQLLAQWLSNRWSPRIIANLKLPMKQRWDILQECLRVIREEGKLKPQDDLRCRQLYHDREEVTVFVDRASP